MKLKNVIAFPNVYTPLLPTAPTIRIDSQDSLEDLENRLAALVLSEMSFHLFFRTKASPYLASDVKTVEILTAGNRVALLEGQEAESLDDHTLSSLRLLLKATWVPAIDQTEKKSYLDQLEAERFSSHPQRSLIVDDQKYITLITDSVLDFQLSADRIHAALLNVGKMEFKEISNQVFGTRDLHQLTQLTLTVSDVSDLSFDLTAILFEYLVEFEIKTRADHDGPFFIFRDSTNCSSDSDFLQLLRRRSAPVF